MTVHLVICAGDPAHVSTFAAFARAAELDAPAIRGETLVCPVSDTMATPVVVVESRVGGTPVIAVHSDEPITGAVVDALRGDPAWRPLLPASGLRGEVVGVFIDETGADLLPVDTWPAWGASRTHELVAVGVMADLRAIHVSGLERVSLTQPPSPPEPPSPPPHPGNVRHLHAVRPASR